MMRASVTKDSATRVVELTLEPDGPAWDLYDVTATWRTEDKRRVFRPNKARVVYVQAETVWEFQSINVTGQRVLKGGGISDSSASREGATWQGREGWRHRIDKAPEWVQEIARQALLGITAYAWTDSERAEEVQAL